MPVTEAPPAPPAASAPPASAPAAATPSPTPVNLTQPSAAPDAPVKPGSVRERQRAAGDKFIREHDKSIGAETPERPKPAEAAKPTDGKPADGKPGDETATTHEPPPEIPAEKKKQNPWKLYRESEARAKQLEQQVAEAKTASLGEKEKAQYVERIEKAEAKLKQQEDELRFKSYEKSDEFKTKFEEPYEQAWNRQWADLREVTINGDDGVARAVTHQDILDLMNLSLPDANKLAREKWGDFANEAMSARKELRTLFNAKANALEEARKTGSDREKTFQENAAKWREGVQKHIKETWESANKDALADAANGEFFKPTEGDAKHNELLTKGFTLVDEAFAANPMDPKWTPEQRADIVRKQAAVRNRAAAFGPMKYILARLRAEVEALKKANGEFKSSQPSAGGGTAPNGAPVTTSVRDRMRAAGDRYAK